MRVKKFIEKRLCSKKELMGFIENADQSDLLLYQYFEKMAALFVPYRRKVLSKEVLDVVLQSAEKLYLQMLDCYLPEWFGKSEQTMKDKQSLMLSLWRRFVPQVNDILEGATLIEVNHLTNLLVESAGEEISFDEPVHFLLKKGDAYQAVIINGGKNGKKSLNGRSDVTRIDVDLQYAVIKTALEEDYKGVSVTAVFYQEGEAKGNLAAWVSNGTQKSNVFHMDFSEFYENGEFLADVLLSRAEVVLELSCQKTQTEKCQACPYSGECLVQKYSERKFAVNRKGDWKLPDFDERQKEFISCDKDEILVCAGPGSGKTASLIGRIMRLAEDGFAPEKMLLVTYTDKAAGELKSRLLGKFPEDEMPRIGTLHSLAVEVDRIYARMRKGVKHGVFSDAVEKDLVKEVLESYDWHLTGVDYRNFIKGDMRYTTVGIVYNRLKAYRKSEESFFYKYRDYVPEEWEKLSKDIDALKNERKYLTYDEFIINASEILEKDTEVRLYYQSLFEHVMVDEFQDINAEQNRLLALLKGDGRLACIGDDDQAIYAFKGCSSRFMQEFTKVYPEAKTIFCNTNYRSTKEIIEFNNSILSQMDENSRIAKVIRCAEYAKRGLKPCLYDKADGPLVDKLIAEAVHRGYSYGDIAVLATKNATLEVLHDTLSAPTELASAFVTKDFLFHVVLNTLAIVIGRDLTLNPFIRLGILYEKDKAWMEKTVKKSLQRDDIYELLTFAKTLVGETPQHFAARIAAFVDLDGSASEKEVLTIAEQVASLDEFYKTLSDMKVYGDNKKIEYPIKNKVTLITSHSCKGMEWPVVIVYDTENFDAEVSLDGKQSMDARLFYVAASRAREELHFLKKEGSCTIIDESEFVIRKKISVS